MSRPSGYVQLPATATAKPARAPRPPAHAPAAAKGGRELDCGERACKLFYMLVALGTVATTLGSTGELCLAGKNFLTEEFVRVYATPCVDAWPNGETTCPAHVAVHCDNPRVKLKPMRFYEPIVKVWSFSGFQYQAETAYVAVGNYSCSQISYSIFVKYDWAASVVTASELARANVGLDFSSGDAQGTGGVLAPSTLLLSLSNTTAGAALTALAPSGVGGALYWSSRRITVATVAGDDLAVGPYLLLVACAIGVVIKLPYELYIAFTAWKDIKRLGVAAAEGRLSISQAYEEEHPPGMLTKAGTFFASNVAKFALNCLVISVVMPDYSDPVALRVQEPLTLGVVLILARVVETLLGMVAGIVLLWAYLRCCTTTRGGKKARESRDKCIDSLAQLALKLVAAVFLVISFVYGATLTFLSGVAWFFGLVLAHHILDTFLLFTSGLPHKWLLAFTKLPLISS